MNTKTLIYILKRMGMALLSSAEITIRTLLSTPLT